MLDGSNPKGIKTSPAINKKPDVTCLLRCIGFFYGIRPSCAKLAYPQVLELRFRHR